MSNAAHRAFAPAPSGSSFEGLTKRLLALRAEIDVILAELAGQPVAMPPVEATATPPTRELAPVLSDPLMDGESMPGAGEDATGPLLEASEIVDVAAPKRPIALESVEVDAETSDHAEQTADDATPTIAVIDTDPAERADATHQCLEAEVSHTADTSAAIGVASAEQPDDAAVIGAPRPLSGESTQCEEGREHPAALADSAVSAPDVGQTVDCPEPAAAAGPALAEAAVVSIQTRQRKQKSELAILTPTSARSSRHLAAKIAACILVLLTAATILVMADRTAMGSAQSFPWMSPVIGTAAATDRAMQRDGQGAPASDDAAATADVAPLSDGILMQLRYRATWPSGS
jgi:hypothetical protein